MANLPSWNNARPKLWRAVQVLLIVGIASGVMKAFFSQPAAASWIGPAPEGPIGPVLRIGIWTGAFALCLFLVWLIPRGYGLLLQILVAVWRPLVLVIAAAWLLICNDQGRELGVSLMGEHSALRIGSLFLALIYWAANNWHTARLGLRDAIQPRDIDLPQGDQNQYWLFWSPLLLGVCAHFLAAINLSLAAWTRPGFDVLAWTAPIFIILVTALACAFDRLYVWQRPIDYKPAWALLGAAVFAIVRLRPTPHDKRAWTLLRAALFAIIRHPPTRDDEPAWTLLGAIVVAIGLLGGIVWVALKTPPDLTGFLWGTIVTILSAIVYLIGVSCWLGRGNPSDDEEERINVRTIVLFSIACLFTFATLRDPVGVGSFFGSMVVAYFTFGAMLALV